MEKVNKYNVEQFCEDNFLDESLWDLMKEVASMNDASAKIIEKKNHGILRIEIKLIET